MTEPEAAELRRALAKAIARLGTCERLTVVEVAAEGLGVFEVRRDEAGTPRGRRWPPLLWTELAGEASWDAAAEPAVTRVAGTGTALLVCSFPGGPRADQAMEWLRAARPEAAAFTAAGTRVDDLLREVIADEPLARSYGLVVLKRHPGSGRLELAALPLFGIGARRGTAVPVTVRCADGNGQGTVFAVVAWHNQRPWPLSVRSARLPPGRHELVAELERPGRVAFTGVPGLAPYDRGWAELVASVPRTLGPDPGPAHLICAVEICGAAGPVAERLSRIRQLVTAMSAELGGRLQVSLLAYGAHSYDWRVKDQAVYVAGWRSSPTAALGALAGLEAGTDAPDGYPYAAQLEDVLAEVAGRLDTGAASRTVLLTVGDRPPHPPQAHRSEILPCPEGHDWAAHLRRLERCPDLSLGAIRDRPTEAADPIWPRLGRDASAQVDVVDIRRLGADLGLVAGRSTSIPFPLAEPS